MSPCRFWAKRRTDGLGFERPTVTDGSILQRRLSFPDLSATRPIYLPRPNVDTPTPIQDIYFQTGTDYYRRPEVPRYTGARTLPRMDNDVGHGLPRTDPDMGPYTFPEHLTTRRLGEVDSSDAFYRNLQPRQNYRNTRQPMNGTVNNVEHLATDRMTPIRNEIPLATLGTMSRATPTQQPGFVADGKNGRLQANEEKRLIKARALAANHHLSYQRLIFTITKYPALIMTMVALWNVAGRGQGMPKTVTENGAYYSAIVTAGFVFVMQMVLSFPHHNSYTKAKGLSYSYFISMILVFCASVLCIVLACLNFKNYQDQKKVTTCKYSNHAPCYSNQERVAYLAVLVGCGAFIIMLSIATIVFGAIGLNLMKKRLREEYRKLTSGGTYFNNGFEY